jgi:ribosome maturation factor RimP
VENAVEKIRVQLNTILETEEDLFLVDFIEKGNSRAGKLVILFDGDNGVTIDQCASISRRLSRFMDENIELERPLTLEVSSAGLEHPILMLRQYQKNIGKNIKTTLKSGEEVEGKLLEATEKEVAIEVLKDKKKKLTEVVRIDFLDINKTIVLISFK